MKWLITCEHYSKRVPIEFAILIDRKAAPVLDSHRGWDIGAAELYHALESLADASFHADFSRLIIEPNRSLHHKQLFSAFTMNLPSDTKTWIIANLYYPYRKSVEDWIEKNLEHKVLHLSVHTFTPVLGNQNRNADIGLLYDPSREHERFFCKQLKHELKRINPEQKVRFNYPYRGTADGFTTHLRKRFGADYQGIEIEVKNTRVNDLIKPIFEAVSELKAITHISRP